MVLQCSKWSTLSKSLPSPQGCLKEYLWKGSQRYDMIFLKLFTDHIQKPSEIIPTSIFCHITEYFVLYVLCRNIIGQGWQIFITHANSSGCTGSAIIWCLFLYLGSLWKNAWSTVNFYHKHRQKNTGTYTFFHSSQKQKLGCSVANTSWFPYMPPTFTFAYGVLCLWGMLTSQRSSLLWHQGILS